LLRDRDVLVLDDGPCQFSEEATAVKLSGQDWQVVAEGVVPASDLSLFVACVILFVCTGNTCRSPLAEPLCKKLLAGRLGCSVEELPGGGLVVVSAGLAAGGGDEAAPEAVNIGLEMGADLSQHRTRPLTVDLAAQADHIVTMTNSHRQTLLAYFPGLAIWPRLLSPDQEDVADPIGGDQEVYRICAKQILTHLEQLLPELLQS